MTTTRSCVRSGYCCKVAACPFGQWDAQRHQCSYLEGERPGDYRCGRYDWIRTQPASDVSPAFDTECCSPLNSDRRKLLSMKTNG